MTDELKKKIITITKKDFLSLEEEEIISNNLNHILADIDYFITESPRIINYIPEENMNKEIIILATKKGYEIDIGTPSFINKNSEYIKAYIENTQDNINYFLNNHIKKYPDMLNVDILEAALKNGYNIFFGLNHYQKLC